VRVRFNGIGLYNQNTRIFYKKKFIRKLGSNGQKLKNFENDTDGIQIRVYTIDKERVIHFSQFISVQVKNSLRKSQALFWENLRKLRLRQNDGLLLQKRLQFSPIKPGCSPILLLKILTTLDSVKIFPFWTATVHTDSHRYVLNNKNTPK